MTSEYMYACDRCHKQVGYGDWFPIKFNLHWCRECVTQYFSEIPESESVRAGRWRDRVWERSTPEERAALFKRLSND